MQVLGSPRGQPLVLPRAVCHHNLCLAHVRALPNEISALADDVVITDSRQALRVYDDAAIPRSMEH